MPVLRRIPYSLEAEQAVLGSMMIDPGCIGSVLEKIKPSDFYLRENREIFEAIYSMFSSSKPIDGLTVADEMQKTGRSDDHTRGYLAQIMEITPTSANVLEYADIIANKAILRELIQTAADITAIAQEMGGNTQEILDVAEQRIFAIRRGISAQNGLIPMRTILPGVLDELAVLSQSETHLPGLSTGMSSIDKKINGLNKSDLILLAARPGVGKTSMALNIALNVAKQSQKTVAVFSLEMSSQQLVARILSAEAMVENTSIKTGQLEESDWERIAMAATILDKVDIRINDNPMITVAEINAQCRRVEDLALVVIDYLQLMTSAGNSSRASENRQQAVSDMTRMLKIMAKALNAPVLCLSQLNRGNEHRENKRPMLSDLRDSGAIEQDADIVMFLYRDSDYNKDADNPNVSECIIAKNRHGETGTVELYWEPEYTRFSVLAKI